jgi:hypothetical protein
MITGGVPFYLSLLDASLSLVQNVDRLFFSEDGQLKAEFRELYPALFKNADNYITVVRALNEKKTGLTRNDIAKATKIQGGTLTKILNNLELCDFIKVFSHYGRNTKNSVYRLTDFYTLFYFRFLEHNKTNDPEFWQHNFTRQSISVWQGFSFENVCLTHISQIKEALKIAGIGTEVSTWRDDSSQIDLIIKRADHTVNVCEIKFSNGPYVVDADYADRIRSRQAHFASVTRTTYGITNTFITVYGVANGKNSSVVQSEVKATDLFAF